MKPKSDNLFHFTKTLDVLKSILKNGVYPKYCLEDFEWADMDIRSIAYPMCCFCDIPLSRIEEHTDFYGNYGIGLSKDWALRNKLEPVIYATQNGSVQKLTKYLFGAGEKNENPSKELSDVFYRCVSMVKPITGKIVIKRSILEKDFYQENEWRFVPPVDTILFEEELENQKDSANQAIEKYKLEIAPNDIRYIFVKSDNDIPSLADFITTDMGNYPHNDLKILQTRIVSLTTLKADL
ncbi:MAG TPA: abortive infection system antitoxin AbiGi family protein [Pontiellaceae bacterium]|nr:abortive infection system antitoxin AbiGi family protein [Pontiellaceae bacterium]